MAEPDTEAVAAVLEGGRTRWADVPLDETFLARYVAERDITPQLARERADDLYLAAACTAGVPAAMVAFERAYLPQVDNYVRRLSMSPDAVDEVRQRLRIRFLTGDNPRIAKYNGTAPLAAYLRVASVRIALDIVGAEKPGPSADDEDLNTELAQQAHVEFSVLRHRYLPMFQQALEGSIDSLSARDKTLLRLHFIDGMNVDALGTIYRVHRATAARWLVDIRKRVFDGVRAKMEMDLRTTPSEFRSLLNVIRSDLRASLVRLLG
jgi:RNA polymerase sigma-70 factor (ECF subfamily)